MEQTRQKYQREFSTINGELEIERERLLHVRGENGRLREELEDLRNKWDNEVLNSSTWAKEKSRMELAVQDITNSRDEVSKAHKESQDRIVSLLSQAFRNSPSLLRSPDLLDPQPETCAMTGCTDGITLVLPSSEWPHKIPVPSGRDYIYSGLFSLRCDLGVLWKVAFASSRNAMATAWS